VRYYSNVAREREPQYVREYGEILDGIGPAAFKVRYRGSVLVGTGMVARVAERPLTWRRRTLAAHELDEIAKVQSVFDRVWRIRKDPAAERGPHIVLGQSADCDLILPEYTVSTKHCAFVFEALRLNIMDLGSLNGTKINGELIEPHVPSRIRDRDLVTLGRIQFRYLLPDSFFEDVQKIVGGRRR